MNENEDTRNGERETNEPTEEKEHICESCGESYDSWETLHRDFGGEIGGISFCPHCKEEVN